MYYFNFSIYHFILLFNIKKKKFKEFVLCTIRMQIVLNYEISIYTLIGIFDSIFLLML